jgi:hypothetical protein
MSEHLFLVKNQKAMASVKDNAASGLSGMDIIGLQAVLMQAGSAAFRAVKSGEIANILTGLVSLAYTALEALSIMDKDDIEARRESSRAYQMLEIVQLLSARIGCCASGEAINYSNLYHLCRDLSSGFLNADFDKAFRVYHEWRKTNPDLTDICFKTENGCFINAPDLTDCLYE